MFFYLILVQVYHQFLVFWANQGVGGYTDADLGCWVRTGGLGIPRRARRHPGNQRNVQLYQDAGKINNFNYFNDFSSPVLFLFFNGSNFFFLSVAVYQSFLQVTSDQGLGGVSDWALGNWVRNGGLNIPRAPRDSGRRRGGRRGWRPY